MVTWAKHIAIGSVGLHQGLLAACVRPGYVAGNSKPNIVARGAVAIRAIEEAVCLAAAVQLGRLNHCSAREPGEL